MSHLEVLLNEPGIKYSSNDSHVQCFPHITNLACKAVLVVMSGSTGPGNGSVDDSTEHRDLVANVRTVIRMIRVSSLRRDHFASLQTAKGREPLQLLRGVDTCWSSTLLMLERFIELKEVCSIIMISMNQDLKKYALQTEEWSTLSIYCTILQVPHAFQQCLSAEKTLTLHEALPNFHSMMKVWENMKAEHPNYINLIDAGLSKLQEYWEKVKDVPAYTLVMCLFYFFYACNGY
ncbi:hypothetical protein FA15DRAFT_603846 [Coprinopsis marcescibilis]|uniref:hAT-like transposase RNase-H fold domain-containing protein n=1 Tax=Coprinopsis marcescibilis TaxID=230819 RepID=A0A5C3KEB6_COPMA|nr:hypothetical protein FA15DRAFT_603846 [Coprinopsis marcescibilis]